MSDHLFRALSDSADVEVCERVVSGILVPWNQPERINERLTEGFRSGAFDRQAERPFRVPFALGHLGPNGTLGGKAVGRMMNLRNDAAGLYGEAKVSETPAGDELLTLLRDGVLGNLSIGFRDMAPNAPDRSGVTWRTSANLTELAVVISPAYAGAQVTGVRAEQCAQCGGTGTLVEHLADQHRAEQAALVAEFMRGLRTPEAS